MFSHDCLRKRPVFSTCSEGFLKQLFDHLDVGLYSAGDFIIRQGDNADKIYFLHRGEVEVLVSPDSKRMATFGSGDFFGEVALFAPYKRTACVRALEFSDCRIIDHRALNQILHQFPKERKYFEQMFRQRLEQFELDKRDLEQTNAKPAFFAALWNKAVPNKPHCRHINYQLGELPAEHATMPCQRIKLAECFKRRSMAQSLVKGQPIVAEQRQHHHQHDNLAVNRFPPLQSVVPHDILGDPAHRNAELCCAMAEVAEDMAIEVKQNKATLPLLQRCFPDHFLAPCAIDTCNESANDSTSQRFSCSSPPKNFPNKQFASTGAGKPSLPSPIARLEDVPQDNWNNSIELRSCHPDPWSCPTTPRCSFRMRSSTVGTPRRSVRSSVLAKVRKNVLAEKYNTW